MVTFSKTLRMLFFIILLLVSPNVNAEAYQPVSDKLLEKIHVDIKTPDTLLRICNERLQAGEALKVKLEALPVTTAPQILLATYDDLYNLASDASISEISLLQSFSKEADFDYAATDCIKRAQSFAIDITQSQAIFERLKIVEAANTDTTLQWSLKRHLDIFMRYGIDKDDKIQAKIKTLNNEILETAIIYNNNLRNNERFITASIKDLVGLPDRYIRQFTPDKNGMIKISNKAGNAIIMTRSENEGLRKRIWIETLNSGYPDNNVVLAKLINKRHELAKLLGYKNYATLSLSDHMAQTPETVRKFMDQVHANAQNLFDVEREQLLNNLSQNDSFITEVRQWSFAKAINAIKTERFNADNRVIRQYFDYKKVRSGVFQLTEDLFDVTIRPWNTTVWSEKVEAYEIVENGRVIGRFYLDMHPRKQKNRGAEMRIIRLGIKNRTIAVGAISANVPEGLLNHRNVSTFFHEFGHLLHLIFSGNLDYAIQNYSGLERDVLETPATLFEEWAWNYDTLKTFAKNKNGKIIPESLVRKMNEGRKFPKAHNTMRSLAFANASLDLFSKPTNDQELTTRFNNATKRYDSLKPVQGAHQQTTFNHFIGYGPSYYTYEWSRAIGADLMSPFRKFGLRDKVTARNYRHKILAPGGSSSMNDLARNFLERDWSVNTYLEEFKP